MKQKRPFLLLSILVVVAGADISFQARDAMSQDSKQQAAYVVGVNDELEINILQPEEMMVSSVVAPDGTINFPYIGLVQVQGKTLTQIQETIQQRLSEGYMRYPGVSAALKKSNSRNFFVYGEIEKPGTYQLDEKTTVLKAITIAGGLNKFGSASRIKILREKENDAGYDAIKVNLKSMMEGSSQDDILLKPGDIVVISEGVF
jgi:polysaccharide export outer membrane protein